MSSTVVMEALMSVELMRKRGREGEESGKKDE